MTVFLCGFMGCGKTTVGKKLAELCGCSYYDMDEVIVKKAGMTIPEIFEKYGEPHFRSLETEILEELSDISGIVSCGGGVMINSINADIAKKKGIVIFLDVPFEICYQRISGDKNRPIVQSNTKEQLEELFNIRHKKYSENSTITVECSEGPLGIAKKIQKDLEIFKKA